MLKPRKHARHPVSVEQLRSHFGSSSSPDTGARFAIDLCKFTEQSASLTVGGPMYIAKVVLIALSCQATLIVTAADVIDNSHECAANATDNAFQGGHVMLQHIKKDAHTAGTAPKHEDFHPSCLPLVSF